MELSELSAKAEVNVFFLSGEHNSNRLHEIEKIKTLWNMYLPELASFDPGLKISGRENIITFDMYHADAKKLLDYLIFIFQTGVGSRQIWMNARFEAVSRERAADIISDDLSQEISISASKIEELYRQSVENGSISRGCRINVAGELKGLIKNGAIKMEPYFRQENGPDDITVKWNDFEITRPVFLALNRVNIDKGRIYMPEYGFEKILIEAFENSIERMKNGENDEKLFYRDMAGMFTKWVEGGNN
jgi:hypothetical protein